MTAQEQRKYLSAMHTGPGPSEAGALKFIDYAAAHHVPVPPRKPRQEGADWLYDDIAGQQTKTAWGSPADSIFIVTASYRDPEVASTLARAFARAAHPERITVGVYAQNEEGEAEPGRDPIGGLFKAGVECPGHPVCAAVAEGRIRVTRELWMRAEGPTVARAMAEAHYGNESFVMGVDSHCHFVRGWDNVMIDMFKRIGNDHALISAYPAAYGETHQGGNGLEEYEPETFVKSIGCIERTRRVNVHNTVSFKHDMGSCATPKNGPTIVAFFAAGFTFSRGHRVLRVPYDSHTPYIFDGEEISMGVRAWTWGYDLYQPDRNIIAHLYIPNGSPLRPVFWTTDWGARWPCQYRSLLRIQEQLRVHTLLTPRESLGVVDLDEWSKYDTGPRRDPRDFFEWAGIRLANEWGDKCHDMDNPDAKGSRSSCFSRSLRPQFEVGGMPYVPWKAGTEGLFPPMRRTPQYPPR